MTSITVIDSSGEQKEIAIVVGLSLMELLRDEGFEEISALCGGSCSCATCHVHIAPSESLVLPTIEEDEEILVMMADNYEPESSRLSCQIQLTDQYDGMRVVIPESD